MAKAKEPVTREAVKMLALEIGVRNAARKLGLNEKTVCTWSRRYKWDVKANRIGGPSTPLTEDKLKAIPSVALKNHHKELEEQTRSGLGKATAKASGWIAEQQPDFITGASARLRDLAAAASRVFGWDNDKASAVTLNQIVVSPEQLEQIRSLRSS